MEDDKDNRDGKDENVPGGVLETCGRGSGGVGRPAPSAGGSETLAERRSMSPTSIMTLVNG
jgi:hypothetical protein